MTNYYWRLIGLIQQLTIIGINHEDRTFDIRCTELSTVNRFVAQSNLVPE